MKSFRLINRQVYRHFTSKCFLWFQILR